ncbi:MAG TPA: tRNA-dihydrouridine synthase [Patescibacteria group bacterium]
MFWSTLPTPIIGLSPMDGVTDHPFRFIQKKYGRPDVVYTEFTSVEGVCHGASRLLTDFLYDESQRPVVAQIYGTTPDFFRQTAVLLCQLGFDGIDINMGCPAKNVAHSGAGAALIKTPKLAQDIIRETKAGVQDYLNGKRARDCADVVEKIWREVEARHQLLPTEYQQPRELPVSVKTRVGYDEKVIDFWIPTLLEMEPAAIAVHGRTLKQQYGGQADWETIGQGAIHTKNTNTLYLGNGDIESRADALHKINTYHLDGALIGRSTFGNPFVFLDNGQPPHVNIFEIALEHAALFEHSYQDDEKYNFLPMRKHLGWYVKSIPYATEIRQEIFRTNNADEVKEIFTKYELI